MEVGFEPTEGLPLHTLSRRAPSATRRLHRRRAYLSPERTACTARQIGCPAQSRLPAAPGVDGKPRASLTQSLEELANQPCARIREYSADHLDGLAEAAIPNHVPE